MVNTDSLISVVAILFILSLVTEKIANFIKLNFKALSQNENLGSKEEKLREKRLDIVTFLSGFLVAFVCKANFFTLFNGEEMKNYSFTWESFDEITVHAVLGCIITGAFLSGGSKFFHDLLNMLMYAKQAKKGFAKNKEALVEILEKTGDISYDDAIRIGEGRDDDPDVSL